MALGLRDLIQIDIRANNMASGTINGVAGSVAGLGTAMSRGSLRMFAYSQGFEMLGRKMLLAGTALFGLATAAGHFAIDFDHAMSLAQTQAQLTNKQLKYVSNAALDVSSKFGVAATSVAGSLYDIFSTTTNTYKEAIKQVGIFAKASVAGAVDIQDATKGVIDIENAFGISAKGTTRILNLQFQMLRKSGGTYSELVTAFGNVIGAARNTDQQLRSVAGSIAFLTLRGRTQAQASISVSRALDQIAKSAGDIKSTLGVNVFTATGDFKQLNDIITEMGKKMAGMTSKERATAFKDMFGQGSIQANRFFRTAIPQFDALNKSVDELSKKQIAGQMEKAFKIMIRHDPSFVFHRLKEGIKNFGIAVFNLALPAIYKLVGVIQKVVDWLNNLSPSTKRVIGQVVVFGAALLTISGAVMLFLGQIMRMISIFKLAATTISGFSLASLAVVAVVAAIGAVVYYVYKHWDTFRPYFVKLWKQVKRIFASFMAWIKGTFIPWIQNTVAPAIGKAIRWIVTQWDKLKEWWHKNGPVIMQAIHNIVAFFKLIWPELVTAVTTAWAMIWGVIKGAVEIIAGIIEVFAGILTLNWDTIWNGLGKIAHGALTAVVAFVGGFAGLLLNGVVALGKILWRAWSNIWHKVTQDAQDWFNNHFMPWFRNVRQKVAAFFAAAPSWLLDKGKQIIIGLLHGVQAQWNNVVNFVRGLKGKIIGFFAGAGVWLIQAGLNLMIGFWNGLKAVGRAIEQWWNNFIQNLKNNLTGGLKIFSPSKVMYDIGKNTMLGFRYGMEDEWTNIDRFLSSRSAKITTATGKGANLIGSSEHVRDVHVHVEAKHSTVNTDEVVREFAWLGKTRGW